jgi:ABC transporter transmembrane region 2
MADLFSNVTKPLLEVGLYVRRLARRVDPLAPWSLIGYLLASGVALTALRKPTGVYTALVQHQVSSNFKHEQLCTRRSLATCWRPEWHSRPCASPPESTRPSCSTR